MKIDFNKYPLPKRFRHHTAPNLYFPIKELKIIPTTYPPIFDKINWEMYFKNGKPAQELDVGCGKGAFLLEKAEQNPELNILGIEIRDNLVKWLQNILKEEKIENCNVLWYSIVNGLNFINNNSIENIYYLFPDPWSKQKHLKRRALNFETLDEYYRILNENGKLYLATDIKEVHEDHISLLEKHKKLSIKIVEINQKWNQPSTNKEQFCLRENIEYYRIIATNHDLV